MNEKATVLKHKIEDKTAHVSVIGLGYVGLPLAIMLAEVGFPIRGIDTDEERVRAVSAGRWPLDPREPWLPELLDKVVNNGNLQATPDYEACRAADVAIICVSTPVDRDKLPDYGALWGAVCGVRENMRGGLVIVESTIAPGTMEDVADMLGPRFWCAHCPERVASGCLLTNLQYMPRIIGGHTEEAGKLASALYLHTILDTELYLTDALTAEIVKCAENAYRDVEIAFANELALICDELGADVWQVRDLVNTCPGRAVLFPGPGVGGACLTKDSWLLASSLIEPPELMLTARSVNDGMPGHVVGLVAEALDAVKVSLYGSIITILGVAYREGTSDVRNSPAGEVMIGLSKAGAEVRFYDPHVNGYDGDLESALDGADAAVIITPHQEFECLDWPALGEGMRHRVLVDTRGIVEDAPEGFVFRGLGRGRGTS